MVVTKIDSISNKRYKIYIDSEFAFVLYKGELSKYGIYPDREISQEIYEEIIGTVLAKRAKLRAMNLLMKREYTSKQLRDKLLQGGYPVQVCEQAVEYVSSFHYIDDDRYASSYLENQGHKKSRNRLIQDLRNKGIPKETIEAALTGWEAEGNRIDEKAQIQKILEKKGYFSDSQDTKVKAKMYRYLAGKGFSSEAISSCLSINTYLT